MTEASPEEITAGSGEDARRIAVLSRPGGEPGIFWLGGFASVGAVLAGQHYQWVEGRR